MLKITIPAYELFNEETQEFINGEERVIHLEHSLISISKWESKWHKPFLSDAPKTPEEQNDYINCMTVTKGVPETAYLNLEPKQYAEINNYISDPMTATTIHERGGGKKGSEIMTSELIYYYMIALNIPLECEKWHLNRLMMLIKVCSLKNQPEKKRSLNETVQSNAALNAARRKQLNSRG